MNNLFRVVAVFLMFLTGVSAVYAQNVRPPGNAVNLDDGTEPGPPNTLGDLSDSDFWRNYRGGDPNDPSQIIGNQLPGQVLQPTGQHWRALRENFIRKYAGWFPVGVIGILLLYHLIKGKMRIKAGLSGKTIPRFTLSQRVAHWYMAGVFILLALSGLLILLGRPVIAPYFGKEANSIITSAAMQGHNLFGPLFLVALVWMFIKFIRGNFFQLVDLKWILKLGGFFGGHVSSSQFNFGEKTWFWMVILIGLVISASGMALLFPWLFADLRILQLSTILHGIGAVVLISVAVGHIYVGTIGMEGSIDSMLKGEVDENWAKEHHDLWYEEVISKQASEKTS
jgi:formate dehydrogenase subunit gamma